MERASSSADAALSQNMTDHQWGVVVVWLVGAQVLEDYYYLRMNGQQQPEYQRCGKTTEDRERVYTVRYGIQT